jgi:hypothetical protein
MGLSSQLQAVAAVSLGKTSPNVLDKELDGSLIGLIMTTRRKISADSRFRATDVQPWADVLMIPANVLKNSLGHVSIRPSAYRLSFLCQMFTFLLYGRKIRQIARQFYAGRVYSAY